MDNSPARIIAGKENGGRLSTNCIIASSLLSFICCETSKVIVEESTASLQRVNTHLEMQDADPMHVAIPKGVLGSKTSRRGSRGL